MSLKWFFKGVFYSTKFNATVQKSKQAGLQRLAAYIRGATIRSLRISQRTSAPGKPPYAKTRGGLRIIQYSLYRNGAIIGPVKFPGSNFFNQPVPHIHEFGGTFMSRKGFRQYPERSYMNSTLQQLQKRGAISKEYSVGMARQWS